MKTNSYIEQAADDLATIRQAVEKVEKVNDPVSIKAANRARILIHRCALGASSILICTEIATGNLATKAILYSAKIASLRIDGLVNIAATLFAACVFIYVLTSKITQDSNLDSDSFMQRHFAYLTSYKFITDLIIKFVIVSIIVIAKKPEWLGPICSIFVADYLLQSRFFVLPKMASLLAGVGCFLVGILSLLLHLPYIVIPSLLFSTMALASLILINGKDRKTKELV